MQSLQLQKEQIRSYKFKQPSEKRLNYLFDNKLIEQFILQVQNLKKQGVTISKQAQQISEGFKDILSKTQISINKLNSSKQGWKINKIDNRSELAVKVTGTNVELRYEGILQMNIQNLCIMIYQAGLFNKWVPFCNRSVQLAEISPLQKTVFLTFKMPFLAERYAYFYGLGIDRIDTNGTIVIYGEGITQKEQLIKRYNVDTNSQNVDKLVVMDLKFFICQISYKSQNQFRFRSYCELDSRMPILPEWLVNAVIKQMGGFIFDKVIKQSNKFGGSVWQKKMNEEKGNPFYPWLKKRLNTWHQMKQKESDQIKKEQVPKGKI